MTRRRTWRTMGVVLATLAIVPLLSGCSARLTQLMGVAADGGGNLSVELRLDPEAQQAINLPEQLASGAFEGFLQVNGERWFAPGAPSSVIRQTTDPDGTVVLTSVHRLSAGSGNVADLRSTLNSLRPLQPILSATGRYWAAPVPGDSGTSTTSTSPTVSQPFGAGRPQAGITGLPTSIPLQTLLAAEFSPARRDRNNTTRNATFTLASRGGVGDVLEPACDTVTNRFPRTTADTVLSAGLVLRYAWAMPTDILESSDGASISANNATATWSMPFGQCQLMELSSVGSDDGRFVNGLILGGALLFLLLVFSLRSITRRRNTPRDPA